MPQVFVSKNQKRKEAVRRIINEARLDGVAQKSDMSQAMGIHPNTMSRKISDPGKITLDELWALLDFLHTPEEKRRTIL